MSVPNHQRSGELKTFLDILDAHIAQAQAVTAFIIIIENLNMLNSAYGHIRADEIIANLAAKLGEEAYRVSDNKIAFIEKTGKKNAAKKNALKKTISSFGFNKDNNNAAHISCLVDYIEITQTSQNAENIFAQLCAQARSQNQDESDGDAKQSRTEMALANQIYKALDDNSLQLAFQPIIEAQSGHIHSHECLLRIVDENGQSGSAGSFIQIAEKMGIINSIDLRVLDMVLDELEKNKNIRLSFNISNLTIGNSAWTKRFFKRITPEIAKRLTVEITETAAMLDIANTAYFIASLQETGTHIALDDFGSGYTSFRQIRSLSLDYVKIDGSLIQDITTNHHNQLLVKSLLEFLKGLNLKTIAEFVDTGVTAKYLIEAGIDYMQGNYFGAAKADF